MRRGRNLEKLRQRLERLMEAQDQLLVRPGVSGLLDGAERLDAEAKAAGTWRPFSWDEVPDNPTILTGTRRWLAEIKALGAHLRDCRPHQPPC